MSLTGRALTLIALTTLLTIVGLWSDDATLQGLWRLPAALILAALAVESAIARRRRFELKMDLPGHCYLGRTIDAHVVLENPSPLPLTVAYALGPPRGFTLQGADQNNAVLDVLRAGAAAVARAPLKVTPGRLGKAEWPVQRARVLGMFGLAWWSRRLDAESAVAVGPDLLDANAQRRASAREGQMAGRASGSGAELHQLREYRVGDPLHRIDWKASARRAALVTREFTEDQHLDVMIVVDAGRSSRIAAEGLDRLGAFANVASRFAEHAVSHDDRVGLVVYSERVQHAIAPLRGRAAVMRVRAALQTSTHGNAESSPLAAALRVRALARQRCLIVWLTDLDDVTTTGELARAVRLLQSRHLVVVAGMEAPEIDALAVAPATQWWEPYRALAAREWRARSRRQRDSLRGAGTPVIAARPADLQTAVLDYYARLRRNRRV